jgi:uncharacterized protein with ParB-like and HNH nuclease domain
MTIGELLDMSDPPIVVPEWQRNYSWNKTSVTCAWLDLQAFVDRFRPDQRLMGERTLGAVHLAQHDKTQILLDGQNRIATATILLASVRDFVARHSGHHAVRLQQKYIGTFNPMTGQPSYKLTLNRFDHGFFQREILETPIQGVQTPQPQIESHKFIWQAKRVFGERLEQYCGNQRNEKLALAQALRVQTALTEHTVVMATLSEWTTRLRYPVEHP